MKAGEKFEGGTTSEQLRLLNLLWRMRETQKREKEKKAREN